MNESSVLPADFARRLRGVRLFVTDFDGVHTDGFAYVDQNGLESVRVNRRDGLAYDMLRKARIVCYIVSKETNPVVKARAAKLGVPCKHGVASGDDKRSILENANSALGISPEATLYIGDDINDLCALEWAGVSVCPADAHPSVIELVTSRGGYVAARRGGEGVIREVVELLLNARGLPLAF